MKYLLTLFSFFLILQTAVAQAPEKMSYQAVVRNISNALVTDTDIGIQISILFGTEIGPSVYTETHSVMTNTNGLMTIEVGTGAVLSGDFSEIDWTNGPFFIKSEIDPEGGTDYTIEGISQLMSVPYALHAESAGNRAYLHLRKKATIQAIPTGSNTTITNYDEIDSEDFTLNNATGSITFNSTGVYVISAHTSFYADYAGRKIIWFECDSDLHPERIGSNECDGIANRLTTSIVGKFNEGDEIFLRVYQNTGVTTDCPSSAAAFDETQISIERIY